MNISSQKLEFWIEKRYNVLFTGKHGVGKSTIVIEAFQKAGLRWAYFSGATMDPFIDFVGVPIKIGEPGQEVIELIRPRHIVEGDIQAIFVDELNRTHKKVRNALMELIQFKTINGKPISSDLRIIWAAINPESDDGDNNLYDVDRLDPAQRDRFQIQCELPYKPYLPYFSTKYGLETATAAVEYWHGLPVEIKDQVSPRRLDYALKVYADGGDVRDVLPHKANVSKLTQVLQNGSVKTQLQDLLTKTPSDITTFFQNENNYARVIEVVLKTKKYRDAFVKLFPPEKIMTLMTGREKSIVIKHLEHDLKTNKAASPFLSILEEAMKAEQNKQLSNISKSLLSTYGLLTQPVAIAGIPHFNPSNLTKTNLGNTYHPGTIGHGILQVIETRKNPNSVELKRFFGSASFATVAGVLSNMKKEGLITFYTTTKSYTLTVLGKDFLVKRGSYTVDHFRKKFPRWKKNELPWE